MSRTTAVFLDTNVYIIGSAEPDSFEGRVLDWAGFFDRVNPDVEVIVSEELFEQVLRVAKRLQNKDWGGEILARIWQKLQLRYVLVAPGEWRKLMEMALIPREDVGVYLTARNGMAEYFISSNHKLVRDLTEQTGEFKCMTPETFSRSIIKDES
jgi:predicted nucleic acid-binding protein